MFSNALQEGIYLHEVLGHAVLGLNHDDPHPTMHQSENLPAAQRANMMLEIAAQYPTLRVMPWSPGLDLEADDLPVQ